MNKNAWVMRLSIAFVIVGFIILVVANRTGAAVFLGQFFFKDGDGTSSQTETTPSQQPSSESITATPTSQSTPTPPSTPTPDMTALATALAASYSSPTPITALPSPTSTVLPTTPTSEPPATVEVTIAAPTRVLSPEAEAAFSYVSSLDGIDPGSLEVVADHPVYFQFLDRHFQFVTILDKRFGQPAHHLLVDPETGTIEDDIELIRHLERLARQEQFGNLEPALHARLDTISDDEELTVAIWVTDNAERSQEELFNILVTMFPEAHQAQLEHGKPWVVDDEELAAEIQEAYHQLLLEDTQQRLAPLITVLEKEGLPVQSFGSMPAVVATLTKAQVIQISQRNDVGMIFLVEGEVIDDADVAIPTNFTEPVWYQGITGNGVTVAVLEDGYIDQSVPCLDIVGVRVVAGEVIEDHKTQVASLVACDDSMLPGMAPATSLLDVSFNNSLISNSVAALQWAIETMDAPIATQSAGSSSGGSAMSWHDYAFDFWARREFALVIKSAGNNGGLISSPGKAWNILTVGATDDNATVNWADDSMWSNSSWQNPSGIDREKPEIVAPGTDIKSYGVGGIPLTGSGTSLAAPQVAGLAALLIDRNSDLAFWPEALRAIIMASATHNIEGPSDIPVGGTDLKDGAGAINAVYADDIARRGNYTAPCSDSCWWTAATTGLPEGNSLYYEFDATAGDTVRVAISWWADVDNNPDYISDLTTDLNLYLWRDAGGGNYHYIDSALSVDNNYELVEFVASQSSRYRIEVRKAYVYCDDGNCPDANYVGVALFMGNAACEPAMIPDVAITQSANDVQLSWSYHSANGLNHEVWRSTYPYFQPGDAGSTLIQTVSGLSYTDAGAIGNPNTNYYYRIKPTSNGCEDFTNGRPVAEFDFSLTPGVAPQPPAAPTNLQFEGRPGAYVLTWTDNSNNETGFRVHDGIYYWTTSANITTYYRGGLGPEAEWWCNRVQAFNNAGDSAWEPSSGWVCGWTLPQ